MRHPFPTTVKPARAAGFSLIELMLAVAIVGIIAAFAYPGYRNYVTEAKRIDAQSMIMEMAARQERFYADRNAYGDKATDIGYATESVDSPEGFWSVASAGTGQAFVVFATPLGTHEDDNCEFIGLNEKGEKRSAQTLDDLKDADLSPLDEEGCW